MSSGLTVRWSLTDAPADAAARLRDYVADSSYTRFSGLEGLAFKGWRMRPGEWFEGSYTFVDDAARAAFQESFTAGVATTPVTVLVGSEPVLVEECEVVAVVAGAGGFTPRPSYDA